MRNNKCGNNFSCDKSGVYLRDNDGNFISYISCKYCIKDLEFQIRKFHRLNSHSPKGDK